MNELDLYKVVYKPEESEGVYGISLVAEPAIERFFITLSKEVREVIKLSNIEKRLITGPVLIPNQKILRYNKSEDKEYNLMFGAEEIRLFSQDFFKNDYLHNSTFNHNESETISNITFVENWIIEDTKNDKANALGFKDLPVGTWMATAYVEDDDTWSRVKSGEIKGFSIDSIINMQKIEMNIIKKNKKEQMDLLKELNKLVTMFSSEKPVELGNIELPEGTVNSTSYSVGELLTLNGEAYVNADITVEGKNVKTDDMGIIISAEPVEEVAPDAVEEVQQEEVQQEELPMDAPVEDVAAQDAVEAIVEAIIETPAETEVDYKLLIENITKQLQDVLNQNIALSSKVEELSKQPADIKLKSYEVKSKGKETTIEALSRIVAENKNKK